MIRKRIVNSLGEPGFRQVHGTVAIATMAPLLFFGWRGRRLGTPLHDLHKQRGIQALGTILRGASLATFVQTFQTPSFVSAFSLDHANKQPDRILVPISEMTWTQEQRRAYEEQIATNLKIDPRAAASASSGSSPWFDWFRTKPQEPEQLVEVQIPPEERHFPVHGIIRITRHPTMLSLFLWSCANMLTRPLPSTFVFWAGMGIFSVVGAIHQDMRMRETRPASMMYQTSLLPFGAVILGRQSLLAAIDEMNLLAAFWVLPAAWLLARTPAASRRAIKRARHVYSDTKLDLNNWRDNPFKNKRS